MTKKEKKEKKGKKPQEPKGRRVFISVLGTGFYVQCRYQSGSYISDVTKFIQKATLENIGAKEWRPTDAAYILLTEKARVDNWEKDLKERRDNRIKEDVPYERLEACLESLNLPFEVRGVDIEDGSDEDEMWKIFDETFNLLQENDILYFDITHSFRYLPMLILVLTNYAKFLKNIKIGGISYGNYEARNKNTNVAPIIDLTPLLTLQDWTNAASDYLRFGDAEELFKLGTAKYKTTEDELKSLKTVVDNMRYCRGKEIYKGNDFVKLRRELNSLEAKTDITLMKPIIEKLKKAFEGYEEMGVNNGFLAAEWCFDHGLFQQAVTILYENVTTAICDKYKLDVGNKHNREVVNTIVHIYEQQCIFDSKFRKKEITELPIYINEEKKWGKDLTTKEVDLVRTIYNDENFKPIFKEWNALQGLRNDLMHAGMRNDPTTSEKMGKKINQRKTEILSHFGINEKNALPNKISQKTKQDEKC